MGRPSARGKLLDCAEALFAEHGLEGVSLRAINSLADLSPAALHYHFGSKGALVEALLERQMPALMEHRRQLLDGLSNLDRAATTREILKALIQPQIELLKAGGDEGLRYMRCIQRLQSDGDLDASFVLERWPGGVDRLAPMLKRANPGLPDATLALRLRLGIGVMLTSLTHGGSTSTAPTASPATSDNELEEHVEAVLDFLTGAFEAPITGEDS